MIEIVESVAQLAPHDRKNMFAALEQLLSVCVDGALGYEKAATDVQDLALKDLFRSFAEQRDRFADELRAMLRRYGDNTERSATLSGSIHRRWMDVRRVLDRGAAASMLAECERGEWSAMKMYHDALGITLPMSVKSLLLDHVTEIRKLHDAFEKMRHPW